MSSSGTMRVSMESHISRRIDWKILERVLMISLLHRRRSMLWFCSGTLVAWIFSRTITSWPEPKLQVSSCWLKQKTLYAVYAGRCRGAWKNIYRYLMIFESVCCRRIEAHWQEIYGPNWVHYTSDIVDENTLEWQWMCCRRVVKHVRSCIYVVQAEGTTKE